MAPESPFDRIVTLAARLFRAPLAFISLVDDALLRGAPIRTRDGFPLGTLRVIDTVARERLLRICSIACQI
jgi:hypothetical protein